jgi:hypothetical protein
MIRAIEKALIIMPLFQKKNLCPEEKKILTLLPFFLNFLL